MVGNQRGQAILLVVVAMSIVLLAALGLAIDGSQYYTQRTMAQVAADAAAEAGIMSIFNGTNTSGTAAFTTSASFNCTTADAKTPCVYARLNGFGSTADDVVTVDFPTSAPGVSLSTSDPVNLLRVTITRTLQTSFMRLLGTNTTTIKAAGTAAIVSQTAAIPILVTHPTKSGALSLGGNSSIIICGGPNRSIQVNSTSNTAVSLSNNTTVNLSHAGPLDPGNCTTGTGGDFGNHGGPSAAPSPILLGSRPGKYVQPASIIKDPLASVPVPALPTNTGTMGTKTSLANGVNGCTDSGGCNLYHPGLWSAGINVKNETAVFAPGVYYINGNKGFGNAANGIMEMSSGLTSDPDTGQGMLVYLTGTGSFGVGANSNATLQGSSAGGTYKGILFFEDRAAATNTHSLGGGGSLSLTGTLYMPAANQTLSFGGNAGSTTVTGEIIVGAISLSGTSGVTMNLSTTTTLVREIALVK